MNNNSVHFKQKRGDLVYIMVENKSDKPDTYDTEQLRQKACDFCRMMHIPFVVASAKTENVDHIFLAALTQTPMLVSSIEKLWKGIYRRRQEVGVVFLLFCFFGFVGLL